MQVKTLNQQKIVKFTNLHQINELESVLKDYIKEIALEKIWRKSYFQNNRRTKITEELEEAKIKILKRHLNL